MDLAGYRTRIRRLSGLRLESLLSTADLDAALNEAYRELVGAQAWPQFRFEETVAVDAGDRDVTLPLATREIEGVVLLGEDRARLAETTLAELERLDPDEEGVPALYARLLPTLMRLYPRPDANVTVQVRGRRLPDPLVLVTDEPEFDEEFHPILAFLVAARLLGEEGDDSGRRESYLGEVGDMLQRMKGRYTQSKDSGIFIMGGQRKRRPSSRVWL